MTEKRELSNAILTGNSRLAETLTRQALSSGADPMDIVRQDMIPAMDEVGRRFECDEYFVPELLLSARAMKAALALIRPLLVGKGAEPVGRVAVGTVKGDLHDIGKNLVASMLEGGGFEVYDLGSDVPPEKFVQVIKEKRVDIVCMSALLTVTMQAMKSTIEALENVGVRGRVTILVGGAPVTARYAQEIGADGYGENASVAVALARSLVTRGQPT